MNVPDDVPRTYKEFEVEIVQGARGRQYGAEGIRPTDRRHVAVSPVYHSPLAAWLALQHLIDVTGSTRVDERTQALLSALCLAGRVVRQHNLLSTATEQERLATLARHVEWWNYVAVPALGTVLGPGSRQDLLAEAARAVVRVPDALDVPPWLQQATRWDVEDGRP